MDDPDTEPFVSGVGVVFVFSAVLATPDRRVRRPVQLFQDRLLPLLE